MRLAAGLLAATVLFAVPARAAPVDASSRGGDASIAPKTLTLGAVTMDFVFVPRGTFVMGSPPSEKDRNADEQEHDVTLSHDLAFARTPVTFAQFDAFVRATGYATEAEKGTSGGFGVEGGTLIQNKKYTWRTPGYATAPELPVTLVTYDDANAFARWATDEAHVTLRLPTEAEYEHAARAGSTSAFASKENDPFALGWFGTNADGHPHAVSTREANAYGLYDTSGNVWEWCADVYGPYSPLAVTDPIGTTPPSGEPLRRVLRGGSFLKDPKNGRSAARYRNTPGSRNADNGFRLVFDPDAPAPAVASKPDVRPPDPVRASGPQSSPAPPRSSGGGGALLAVPLGLGCFGGFLALLVWLLTRVGSAARGASNPNVTTRVVSDGFFVVCDGLPIGSRVRYECMVRGVPVTDVVPTSGRETFVYTGGAPEAIRILEVVAFRGSSYRGAPAPVTTFGGGRRGPAPRHEPRPFSGTPRAY